MAYFRIVAGVVLCVALEGSAFAAEPTSDDAHVGEAAPVAEAPRPSPMRYEVELLGFLATPFESGGSDALGFGLSFGAGWRRIPVTVGLDLFSGFWGTTTTRSNVQSAIGELAVDKTRTDSTLFFDAWVRVQPPDWRVRPYVEGLVGTKLLRTEYSLSFVGTGVGTDTVTDHDWAGSIGWGAGIDLAAAKDFSIAFGVRRLAGAKASFSRSAIVGTRDDVVRYDLPTDTTIFSAALVGRFGGGAAADGAR